MKNNQFTRARFRPGLACAVGVAIVLCQLIAASAHAALISIAAPPSVEPGALTSASDVYIFLESTTTLDAPLAVDLSKAGLYNNSNPDSTGSIAAGTKVASYMIHHDSVGFLPNTAAVSFVFSQPILGIIINDTNLNLSDPLLGNPGTTYPTDLAFRGLEVPYNFLNDVVLWSGNQVTFTGKSTTALVIDQVRVITAVPEPSSLMLGLVAIPAAWLIRRRQAGAKISR